MELKDGTYLCGGKYRIIRFLNAGGFGCTYEGVHTSLNMRVAIKEFFIQDYCNRDQLTGMVTVGTKSRVEFVEKLRNRFIREARVLSSLVHPGIVKVSDVFEYNGTAYYVMEYIEGQSLGQILKMRGRLAESEAVGYIRQICDALKYIHSKNHLHLDIKPDNIMVKPDGKAVLIDFGASKQLLEGGFGGKTFTTFGFTPGYAPAEQKSGDSSLYSPATDIYSLGATFYHLLTGNIPPNTERRTAGIEVPRLPSNISQHTRNAVERSLQMNWANRPHTLSQFLDILDGTDKGMATEKPNSKSDLNKTQVYTGKSRNSKDADHKNTVRKWAFSLTTVLAIIILIIAVTIGSKDKGRASSDRNVSTTVQDSVVPDFLVRDTVIGAAAADTLSAAEKKNPEVSHAEKKAFAKKVKQNLRAEDLLYEYQEEDGPLETYMFEVNNYNKFEIEGSDYQVVVRFCYSYGDYASDIQTFNGVDISAGGIGPYEHSFPNRDVSYPAQPVVKFKISDEEIWEKYH